jgi:DNA-binding transcriptional LysR family regulator
MLDLKNLETFVWVARLGGFRSAADKLHTTQPSVSNRIAQIEAELGGAVFERGPRGAGLTPKGRELLGYAERMLALRSEAVAALTAPGSVQGVVRLGTVETIGHTWLPRLLKDIAATYPRLTLSVDVDTTPRLREGLLARSLDLAFLLGPFAEPWTQSVPLSTYPQAWIARPDLPLPSPPISLAALREWPIMTYARNTPVYLSIEKLLSIPGERAPRLYGNSSLSTITRLALDGIGIAAAPPILVRRELEEGLLKILDSTVLLDPLVFLAAWGTTPNSHLIKAVIDMARPIAQAAEPIP